MICYKLRCDHDHTFEAWFKDSAAYDEQVAYGEVQCPYCGTLEVRKAVMAPALARGRGEDDAQEKQQIAIDAAEQAASDMRDGMDPQVAAEQFMDVVNKLHQHVEETCENVGDNFAEEVRAIHYGEAEQRGIYGTSSIEDAQELAEEGIDILPLPRLGDKDKAN